MRKKRGLSRGDGTGQGMAWAKEKLEEQGRTVFVIHLELFVSAPSVVWRDLAGGEKRRTIARQGMFNPQPRLLQARKPSTMWRTCVPWQGLGVRANRICLSLPTRCERTVNYAEDCSPRQNEGAFVFAWGARIHIMRARCRLGPGGCVTMLSVACAVCLVVLLPIVCLVLPGSLRYCCAPLFQLPSIYFFMRVCVGPDTISVGRSASSVLSCHIV